jgi:hypothetical protein
MKFDTEEIKISDFQSFWLNSKEFERTLAFQSKSVFTIVHFREKRESFFSSK